MTSNSVGLSAIPFLLVLFQIRGYIQSAYDVYNGTETLVLDPNICETTQDIGAGELIPPSAFVLSH